MIREGERESDKGNDRRTDKGKAESVTKENMWLMH